MYYTLLNIAERVREGAARNSAYAPDACAQGVEHGAV